MKTLEEKKLLVKMMQLFGQSIDQELVESIKREETLRKVFFKEDVKESKIQVELNVDSITQPKIIETPVTILKNDLNPKLTSLLGDLSKEELIDVIEEMTDDIDIMELYDLENESLIYLIRELSKNKISLVEVAPEPVNEAPIEKKSEEDKSALLQKEMENLQKKLDILQKRFNNSITTGSGGGVVRMSDLDNLIAKHDIIPDLNEIFNLGSPDRKFKSLYLSGNTIVLGNTTIKGDSAGGLTLSQTSLEDGGEDPEANTVPVTITGATIKSLAAPIIENDNVIVENYTISTNKNAKSYGPIKLNKSVTFKIPKSSKWKILA